MINKRIASYVEERMTGVSHTTLNPKGPGVVRIHLVPPKEDAMDASNKHYAPSVAIINGKDIIPVNISWAILLNEFINQLNSLMGYGEETTEFDLQKVVYATIHEVKKVFPFVPSFTLIKDLRRIVNTLCDVAYGRAPSEKIGYMNIGEYAPFMKAPHRMDLMISAMEKDGRWNCNQKCLHCYAAGQSQANVQELSTKQWFEVIDKCREIGIPQITFTGGEPTIREDLVELVKHSEFFVTRLNTNGIRLTEKLCSQLYDASLDSVQITLYSWETDIQYQLTGFKNFLTPDVNVYSGIFNALNAGLNVSINTPLCTLNKDYVETLKHLHLRGVKYVSCSGLIMTGNACNEASKATQLSSEELYSILKDAKAYCDANGMEISFTSPGWIEEEKLREIGMDVPTCGACLSNMAIAPDGGIMPCQSWLSDEPLGNILKDPWEEVWNGSRCKAIREHSAKMDSTCPLRKRV